MSIKTIMKHGEYLGFCPIKGYLYSNFVEYDRFGNPMYRITAIKDGEASYLIDYKVRK